MEKQIKIFCEGITDQFFLADFIEITFGLNFTKNELSKNKNKFSVKSGSDIEIIDVGGCTKLSNRAYSQMLEDHSRAGGINLVIFDADYESLTNGNRGFTNCRKKLNSLRSNSLKFDYYIWPDNSEDGVVEDLIIETIAPANKDVFDCINAHCDCLKTIKGKSLQLPDLKAKINFLVHTLQTTTKLQKRDYKDATVWEIDLSKSNKLKKLYSFLGKYLNE